MVGVSFQALLMKSGGTPDATITFVSSGTSTTDLTTYNFAGLTLGGAYAIICIYCGTSTSTRVVSSMSAGGQAGTFVLGVMNFASSFGARTEIWIVPNPGASGTVSVTWNGSVSRCAVSVYAASNLLSSTATDTDTSVVDPMTTSAVTINAGGILVAAAGTNDGALNTWTGATEDFDSGDFEGGQTASSASLASAAGSTPTVTCDPAGASSRRSMAVASFR